MIFVHLADQIFFPNHQARLRAAEDLVAAKGHDTRSGLNSFRDDWFLGQAVLA